MRKASIRRPVLPALALGLVLATACDGNLVTNPNSPSQSGGDPLLTAQFVATGILGQSRDQTDAYVRDMGLYGREVLFFQLQDSRWVTGYLRDWQDPNSFGAGGNWAGRYRNIRNTLVLRGIATNFNAQSKAAADGFAKTFEALELYYVIASKDSLGAPTAVTEDPNEIQPFVSRDSVYRYISNKLDEAQTDLQAGGASFPFTLHNGFAGFNTPATFVRFNRAIKARVEAIRATQGCGNTCYQAALAAVTAANAPATGSITRATLDVGAYQVYSTAAGDVTNGISRPINPQLYAHPSIEPETNPADLRYIAAIQPNQPSQSLAGSVSSTLRTIRYPANNSPIPIFRNEELVLIRAEASYFTGNQAAALDDINAIRTVSGGQAARGPFASNTDFTDELLYQRRLSLFLEGHRWVDVRRFRRLSTLPPSGVPPAGTGFSVAPVQVVPNQECLVRNNRILAGGSPTLKAPSCP